MSKVVVDASLVVKCLIPEELSTLAVQLWGEWTDTGVDTCAPPLLEYEVGSVLRRKVRKKAMVQDAMDTALEKFDQLRLTVQYYPGIYRRACEIAKQGNQERIYDSVYAAHAEREECELWTADENFFKAVRGFLPFVKYLGHHKPLDKNEREARQQESRQ